MDHFLLTRFNVRVPGQTSRPSRDWMEHRLGLFEKYCVSSILAQDNLQFTWLVFLDEDTDEWARQRLESMREARQNVFRPIYINSHFTGKVAGEVVASLSRSEYVATTRIDNDDAVAVDFISTIQAYIHEDDFVFVNLVEGAQWQAGRIYLRPYRSNPFITLIERRQDSPLKTVFVGGHDELAHYGPMEDVYTGRPMWLQVVHGSNLANEIVGFRSNGNSVSGRFPVEVSPVSLFELTLSRLRDVVRIGRRIAVKPSRGRELMKVALGRCVGGTSAS